MFKNVNAALVSQIRYQIDTALKTGESRRTRQQLLDVCFRGFI